MRISDAVRYLLFLVIAASLTNSANAGIIVALQHDPATTAGGGATSTLSGPGTWHLYAIDDSNIDLGISSYNIRMSGASAIKHRSPVTAIIDSNGDAWAAGFSQLRTTTNVDLIFALQGTAESLPFPIFGLGQSASDFITKSTAIDAGAVVVGPTTSGAWGNYNSPILSNVSLLQLALSPKAAAAVGAGKRWVFLAEGLGAASRVTSAVVTVFDSQRGSSATTLTTIESLDILPEPSSILLLLSGLLGFTCTARQR